MTLNVDGTPRNTDWLRVQHWHGPATVSGLLHHLGVTGADPTAQHAAVQRFLATPAAEALPVELRAGLRARGLL